MTTQCGFIKITLEDLEPHSVISLPVHVDNANGDTCDLILGMDTIVDLGLIIDGEMKRLKWGSNSVPLIEIIEPRVECHKEIGKPCFTSITQVRDELVRK